MRKTAAALLAAVLATTFSLAMAAQTQLAASPMQTQQSQLPSLNQPPYLPSPFIIAAAIVGLVALFGTVLSLLMRRRSPKRNLSAKSSSPRWWIIDSAS